MATTLLVEPDSAFIREVLASGGEDLKKCFQCATCSSVCTLSEDRFAFPRRLMISAQWGLKEKVLADPAIWLCHDCGDCTANCPRAAKPSNVMGALRREAIKRYAFPSFAGTMVSSPKYLALLLLVPLLIFGTIGFIELQHGLTEPYIFAELFPAGVLEPLFYAVSAFVVLSFAVGVSRFVKDLRACGCENRILPGLVPALGEILAHKRFSKCTTNRDRYLGHMLALFGFVGLGITGTSVGIGTMFNLMETPLPLLSAWKVFANLSAVLILVGTVLLIGERIKTAEKWSATTYFDGLFLVTLAGVVATGFLSEFLRLAQSAGLMYSVYYIHLTLIFSLFLYAPYSKFAHFVYRTIAMAAASEAPLKTETAIPQSGNA
jgi:quinone-modifying oxidoreductase, subunit QmoC